MNKFQNKKNFQLPSNSMTCSGTTMRSRHLILPGNRNKFIWKDATLSFLVNYHCIIFLLSGIDIGRGGGGGVTCMTKMSHSMLRRLVKSNFIDSYVEVVNCQNPICRDCGSAQWFWALLLTFCLNDDLIFHYVCLSLVAWFLVVVRGMSAFCFHDSFISIVFRGL